MRVLESNTLWGLIKRFYRETFNIPEYYIECLALLDILKRSVSGYSNIYIGRVLQLPSTYVKEAVSYCLDFNGWDTDLDFNALACYNKSKDYNEYYQEVSMVSAVTSVSVIRLSYNLCKMYYEILEELDRYLV